MLTDDEIKALPTGITKREYFACHAPITMQDAHDLLTHQGHGAASYRRVVEEWVKMRADYADALIGALERKTNVD